MFYVIPDISDIDSFMSISEKYNLGWEYNDFIYPEVYDNPEKISSLSDFYLTLDRDRSLDTMHGAFFGLDLAATDPVISSRSKELLEQSLQIAERLEIKGVVFHTGLIGGLRLPSYIDNWLNKSVAFWKEQCEKHPNLSVYMENTFEQEPDVFVKLMQRMQGVNNFKLCLDYGHAMLTKTPIEEWCKQFAPYTGHMHINDNDLVDDLHLVPGNGKIDFNQYKELMHKYDINVSILIELKGYDNAKKALEFCL